MGSNVQIGGDSRRDSIKWKGLTMMWSKPGRRVAFSVIVGLGLLAPTGQAGAVVLGSARALCLVNDDFEKILRANKFLTRDSRMRERKKYGQKGARARFQFSKR